MGSLNRTAEFLLVGLARSAYRISTRKRIVPGLKRYLSKTSSGSISSNGLVLSLKTRGRGNLLSLLMMLKTFNLASTDAILKVRRKFMKLDTYEPVLLSELKSEIETKMIIFYGTLLLRLGPKSETVLTFDLKNELAKFYGPGASCHWLFGEERCLC